MRFFLTTTWSLILCFIYFGVSGQTTTSLTPSQDNSIYSENTNSNGIGKLYAGQTCGGDNRRALMQFDLSSIPAGATITSVMLIVNADNVSSSAGTDTYNLHSLTQAWGEGTSSGGGSGAVAVAPDATWTDAISGGASIAWTTAGGDFSPSSLASFTFPASTGTDTFTSTAALVSAAQSWLDAPATNFGMILIGNESSTCTARRFGSKDQGTAPVLEVTWTPPGIATCGATAPIITNALHTNAIPLSANTPAPVLTQNASSQLPNVEYIVTFRGRTAANSNGGDVIMGTDVDGILKAMDMGNYGITFSGVDTMDLTAFGYDLSQMKTLTDALLNNEISPGNPCCNIFSLIPNATGFCDSVNNAGISGANDVNNLSDVMVVISALDPTGELSIERLIANIDLLNSYQATIPSNCGGGGLPICYGVDSNSRYGYELFVCTPTASTINPVVCGSYTVPSGDSTYTMSGMYMDTIMNVNNCDSVITINLTVNTPTAATISPTACDSFIAASGMVYYTSGMYMDTIMNAGGCDSVITINLTIGEVYGTLNATSCTGSYMVPSGNATYTMSGTYMDTIASTGGCDSILTINLTIDTATTGTISPSVCASYTVPSMNATYTVSGTYMDTIPNMAGCDSILTINLTVTGQVSSTISAQSCTGSYTAPSGVSYTMSGTYMDTIASAGGCDSIITINLTVGLPTAATISAQSCTGSYTVPSGNASYTTSGTYMDTIANISGCDSVLTINLTVGNPSFSYGAGQYCSSTSGNTSPTITGTTGGSFSTTTGLNLNSSTGEITMSGSSAGSYMVSYSINGCQDSVSVELGETLSISLAYSGNQCTGTTGAAPTITGYTGTGTFGISPAGLGISSSTGALNLGGTTTGTYTVNYTANDICSSTASTSVTVTNTPAASFSYDSVAYCQESTTNPVPNVTGGTSGSFLCLSGAVVNGSTGQLNLNASTANYHPIHYITTGTCPDTVTTIVRILDCLPPVSVNQIEEAEAYRLMPNPNNGNFAIINDKVEHVAHIQVFDLVGKMVHAEQVLLAEDGVHHIQPAQQLIEGYYFVRIIDEQQQKTFKMQVLNR